MSHATTPPPRDLAEVIRSLSAVLTRQATEALAGDVEGVHQARVAARRLREALALVTGPLARDAAALLRADARRVRSTLGPVRDADVMVGLFNERVKKHRWLAIGVALVRHHLVEARELAARAAMRSLGGVDLLDLVGRSAQVTAALERDPQVRAAAQQLTRRARRRARGLLEAIRQAGPFYEPARFHDVRIAAKKLRYVLELGRDLGRIPISREIDALRTAQNTLGRLHDVQDLQTAVDAVASRPPTGQATRRALAIISAALAKECRALHAAFLLTEPGLAEVAHHALVLGQTTFTARMGRIAVKSQAAPRADARKFWSR